MLIVDAPFTPWLSALLCCRTGSSDDGSVLEDLAAVDGIAAGETIGLRAQRIGRVVGRHDDVVELPDRAVLVHAWHGVVDVELLWHALRLGSRLPGLVRCDRVDE